MLGSEKMKIPENEYCELTLLFPLFNEEEVLPQLVSRITECLHLLPARTEVILINDGSSDRTRELIHKAVARNSQFVGIHFSRNFGHQQAVSAGLAASKGEYVAVLDGDLQDPPEIVPKFLAKAKEGFDVVYAIREKRKEGILKKTAYRLFYRILDSLSKIHIPLDSGDFCLISRRVAKTIVAMPERHRFIRGLRAYCGFCQTGLRYERDRRLGGEPKYTLVRLLGLAADGVFTFSERPLKVATLFGFLSAATGFLYAAYLLIWRLSSNESLPGFATIVLAILFMGGVQLICLGILGEYIGRIHNEVKGRPSFIIDTIETNKSS